MSFDMKGFNAMVTQGRATAPLLFGYCNEEDLLSEMMEPGYFQDVRYVVRGKAFIKVISKDHIAEILIDNTGGKMVVRDEILVASDPWKDLKAPSHRRNKKEKSLAATG